MKMSGHVNELFLKDDRIGNSFNVYLFNALFEFLFVMLTQKGDFSFWSRFNIYNKK